MGRSPCHEKVGLKKGPWTAEEDQKLLAYIEEHGHGSWRALPAKAGLQRCGKSCRLRWTNYLRPDIKRGKFSLQEEQTIIQLHALLGNRWSAIATHLEKRTDNEIKNYWNTHLKKRLTKMGIDPVTHKPKSDTLTSAEGHTKSSANLSHMAQWESARLEAEVRLVRESKLRAATNPTSPTSTIAGTFPVQLEAPRLDMLRAWQGGWSSNSTRNGQSQIHGGINLESPTSTLTFSDNNNPGEAVDWKSLTGPINKDLTRIDHFVVGGSQTEPSLFSSSGVVLNANMGDGSTEMLMKKYSDEENSTSEGNLIANSGKVCGGSGGGDGENEEEHKSYWNSILKLVNSANLSGSSPLF